MCVPECVSEQRVGVQEPKNVKCLELGPLKIDRDRQLVVLEEELEVRPPGHHGGDPRGVTKGGRGGPGEPRLLLDPPSPTFVAYSYQYKHDDGRVSYPLCLIFSSPLGCKPEQQMMYAGSKNRLVQATQLTKVSGS
ncbi:glia maturation factor gamma [Alligator sinensis]|uniref:Glia maturation factor gamma n=1 Tax=Alligator sinensis TaxID=38654 RepID=A0A3Q0FPH5_ALLSI|nr:glia maturation factor gamma [Alligator sinensis]